MLCNRNDSNPHLLCFIPILTLMVLGVLWGTIFYRLGTEKAMALHNARLDAHTVADSLRTTTLKAIHDIDEVALLVVNDRRYGAKPGSAYWSHLRIGVKEPADDRRNGATSGSP